jgi:hypothetical protein
MQTHTMYFDHQCLVRLHFYFLRDICQHLLYGFKDIHMKYNDAVAANIATLKPD